MYLTELRPEELRDAIKRDIPALMAAGVVEYHGPHLPIGTDTLIAEAVCDGIEERCECIRVPSIPFGPTGSWAAGPEDGELDMPCEPFFQYAKAVLRGLLDMGFDRIYVVQHHQGPEGGQQLCLKRAAYECNADDGREHGSGWGRIPTEIPEEEAFNPWNRIEVGSSHEWVAENDKDRVPIGHGSKGETQLMMAYIADRVQMDALPDNIEDRPRWLHNSDEATVEEGEEAFELMIDGWVEKIEKDARSFTDD